MKHAFLAIGLVLAAAISLPVAANPINLGHVYTGSTPDGSAPWLTATFAETDSTHGTLTLTSNFSSGMGDFVGSQPGWAFSMAALTAASCDTGLSTNCPDDIGITSFDPNGPIPGLYNLLFSWNNPPGSRFDAGDTAVFDLTFASDLAANSDPFFATPNPDGNSNDAYISFAHVQSIGPAGECSGWIVDGAAAGTSNGTSCGGGHVSVPEPAELGMFGLGLLFLGLFVGLRRRRA